MQKKKRKYPKILYQTADPTYLIVAVAANLPLSSKNFPIKVEERKKLKAPIEMFIITQI